MAYTIRYQKQAIEDAKKLKSEDPKAPPTIPLTANKLIMPDNAALDLAAEERKADFLRLAGSWSDAEGEEYYQMMKHRNDGRPVNRENNRDD